MTPERIAEAEQAMIERWRRADGSIDWVRFVQTLAQWCEEFGWILEYGEVDDESCAIFYQASRGSDGNSSCCTGVSNEIS